LGHAAQQAVGAVAQVTTAQLKTASPPAEFAMHQPTFPPTDPADPHPQATQPVPAAHSEPAAPQAATVAPLQAIAPAQIAKVPMEYVQTSNPSL